jgi:hypothetical protein
VLSALVAVSDALTLPLPVRGSGATSVLEEVARLRMEAASEGPVEWAALSAFCFILLLASAWKVRA